MTDCISKMMVPTVFMDASLYRIIYFNDSRTNFPFLRLGFIESVESVIRKTISQRIRNFVSVLLIPDGKGK